MTTVDIRALPSDTPMMLTLMEPVAVEKTTTPRMGAMTKYKTHTGETIGGQPAWNYDYHDDDV
jgi:hypothetical protein